MNIVLFRTTLKRGADMARYEALAARMYDFASKMPGFVSIEEASLPDGDSLAIVAFESDTALDAWRQHPEHVEAQRQGREEFYERYAVKACRLVRGYEWPADAR